MLRWRVLLSTAHHAQYLGEHIINCLMGLAHQEHMILVYAHSSSLTLNGINSSSNVNNKLKRLWLGACWVMTMSGARSANVTSTYFMLSDVSMQDRSAR